MFAQERKKLSSNCLDLLRKVIKFRWIPRKNDQEFTRLCEEIPQKLQQYVDYTKNKSQLSLSNGDINDFSASFSSALNFWRKEWQKKGANARLYTQSNIQWIIDLANNTQEEFNFYHCKNLKKQYFVFLRKLCELTKTQGQFTTEYEKLYKILSDLAYGYVQHSKKLRQINRFPENKNNMEFECDKTWRYLDDLGQRKVVFSLKKYTDWSLNVVREKRKTITEEFIKTLGEFDPQNCEACYDKLLKIIASYIDYARFLQKIYGNEKGFNDGSDLSLEYKKVQNKLSEWKTIVDDPLTRKFLCLRKIESALLELKKKAFINGVEEIIDDIADKAQDGIFIIHQIDALFPKKLQKILCDLRIDLEITYAFFTRVNLGELKCTKFNFKIFHMIEAYGDVELAMRRTLYEMMIKWRKSTLLLKSNQITTYMQKSCFLLNMIDGISWLKNCSSGKVQFFICLTTLCNILKGSKSFSFRALQEKVMDAFAIGESNQRTLVADQECNCKEELKFLLEKNNIEECIKKLASYNKDLKKLQHPIYSGLQHFDVVVMLCISIYPCSSFLPLLMKFTSFYGYRGVVWLRNKLLKKCFFSDNNIQNISAEEGNSKQPASNSSKNTPYIK